VSTVATADNRHYERLPISLYYRAVRYRWQDSGRLRGYGHVVFDSEESRSKAIQDLSGKNLGQRYLTIQAPKAPRADTTMGATESRNVRDQPEGCKTVHVKNLPWDATEEDIREVFQVCGKILEGGVRIARNYTTRESKGFAYVEYKNPEGAHGAVNKAAKPFGMTVKGRPCFVDYDEGSMKGSFKTADGRLWARQYDSKWKQHSSRY
jgi:nucleolin